MHVYARVRSLNGGDRRSSCMRSTIHIHGQTHIRVHTNIPHSSGFISYGTIQQPYGTIHQSYAAIHASRLSYAILLNVCCHTISVWYHTVKMVYGTIRLLASAYGSTCRRLSYGHTHIVKTYDNRMLRQLYLSILLSNKHTIIVCFCNYRMFDTFLTKHTIIEKPYYIRMVILLFSNIRL